MSSVSGLLRKMRSQIDENVIYELPVSDDVLALNPLIGKRIALRHNGSIVCSNCQRVTKKSFNQGYCFPCSQRLARCDMCIVRPERCHFDKGTCREPVWGEANCMQDHVVYLANSSALKVGITRATQIPTRWVDQGASQALPILRVASRLQSGLVEMTMAEHVSDKTNWRKMLKMKPDRLDLFAERDRLLGLCAPKLKELRARFGDAAITAIDDHETVEIDYPVDRYPETIRSHNLDKTPSVEGVLHGIKGQYLILDTGVLNIRKYTSYDVTVDY